MSNFSGILRYEFLMQIRRKAVWAGMAVPFVLLALPDVLRANRELLPDGLALGDFVILQLIFVPIVAGFFLSDRLYRDQRLATDDWVSVSSANKREYLWGKYVGAVAATLMVTLVYWMVAILVECAIGSYSPNVIGYGFIAFWVTAVPAYFFIGAYSVALPRVMSLRLYQILFTCYWLWIHQQLVPSVGGTPLAPSGEIPLLTLVKLLGIMPAEMEHTSVQGPFGWSFEITPAMSVLNIGLLLVLACIVLFIIERYMVWVQEHN